jgi:hypothetical protein
VPLCKFTCVLNTASVKKISALVRNQQNIKIIKKNSFFFFSVDSDGAFLLRNRTGKEEEKEKIWKQ